MQTRGKEKAVAGFLASRVNCATVFFYFYLKKTSDFVMGYS